MADSNITLNWIEEKLFGPHAWYPCRLGPERLIFSTPLDVPLLAFCMDPVESQKSWVRREGLSYVGSFFRSLEQFVGEYASDLIYATQSEASEMRFHFLVPFSPERWRPEMLFIFEHRYENRGWNYLVLPIVNGRGALIFSKGNFFKISYHGDGDVWEDVLGKLDFELFDIV